MYRKLEVEKKLPCEAEKSAPLCSGAGRSELNEFISYSPTSSALARIA
jgi:hypothetical protein